MADSQPPSYILGLDIGSSSIGWALAGLDAHGEPEGIIKAGVRIFEPGVSGTDLDIQRGKDESKAVQRRRARLQRRQIRRHAARRRELFELLQQNGLLPEYAETIAQGPPHLTNAQRSAVRHQMLDKLDAELYAKWKPRIVAARLPAADHVLPYFLRASALRGPLEPFELGRAFYHLGQRRGFKSNRREGAKTKEEEEEKSKVYSGISELTQQMQANGAQTIAELFARTSPDRERIRRRWTARSMFENEFEAIWTAQAPHRSFILTSRLKRELHRLLFFQRPIAAQTRLIGECELERGRKRAPLARLEAQRFRLLQKVNDLKLLRQDFTEERLAASQRSLLLSALETHGDLTFGQIRQLLGLRKNGHTFNLERGGEKRLPGNRTNSKMLAAFGERWNEFPAEQRQQIVEEWRNAETEEWLTKRGMGRWGLNEERAKAWANASPEEGYSRLSRRAIAELLPMMEEGFPFKEAEKEIYGTHFSGGHVYPSLPPVRDFLPSLRNPAVERALTELRKVVNAIIREHGRPHEIHVELARDLKRSRNERKELWRTFRERQGNRERLATEISKKTGIQQPTRSDIEKAMLWEECRGICPYTGKSIDFADLFSDTAQFDVEHILPLSRCPDDSFSNKTLCHLDENRNVKRGRTPWEAYGANPELWSLILERVRRFGNPGKLKRFLVKTRDESDEFSSRQLNDTRYSSKLAAQYLGALFGGRDAPAPNGANRRAVYASPGGLTAVLRRNWGLEAILSEPEPSRNDQKLPKSRSDHRHHAIDAIVIALSTSAALKALSEAASRNAACGRESFKSVEGPWNDFVSSIRPHIQDLVVSRRAEHKLSGQLHDETLYGRPAMENGKSYVHVRKPVDSLSKNEIQDIVDPAVRAAVEKRLAELGDLKKFQTAGSDPPHLLTNGGERIPIRTVRIRKVLATRPVGEGLRLRHVAPNNNHHMEIIAEMDDRENEIRWDGDPVSLLEAQERRRKAEPIVQRDHGKGLRFKFSVMGGDTIEVTAENATQLFVVRTIATNGQISLAKINDARLKAEMQKAEAWWRPRADALRKLNARKVTIGVLGKVFPSND
jgi:CRISPR-associated endonuclease Csn1